jgi:hypothetical protein
MWRGHALPSSCQDWSIVFFFDTPAAIPDPKMEIFDRKAMNVIFLYLLPIVAFQKMMNLSPKRFSR